MNMMEYGFLAGQGYLFQEAFNHELTGHNTVWSVRVVEYLFSIFGQDTHADMIIRSDNNPERYVSVDCKRADPKYSYWLVSVSDLNLTYSLHCTVLRILGENGNMG